MKIYFTSDLHFHHDRLLILSKDRNKKFKNINHMHNVLITNWNNRVNKEDTVYILGDFCLGNSKQKNNILNKLNGSKVIIKGNHDKKEILLAGYIRILGKEFEIVHNPEDSVSNNVIHGHIHKEQGVKYIEKEGRTFINVNTELWDYTPVSLKQLNKIMRNKK